MLRAATFFQAPAEFARDDRQPQSPPTGISLEGFQLQTSAALQTLSLGQATATATATSEFAQARAEAVYRWAGGETTAYAAYRLAEADARAGLLQDVAAVNSLH